MAKAPFSGKIVTARFANEQNTSIEVQYNNAGKTAIFMVPVDETNAQFKALVEEGWGLEKISEATIEWMRSHNIAVNDMLARYIKHEKDEARAKYEEMYKSEYEKRMAPVEQVDRSGILEAVIENNTNEETLFKMKLNVLKLPAVKDSKKRSKKMKIRKASSIIEILSIYEEIIAE